MLGEGAHGGYGEQTACMQWPMPDLEYSLGPPIPASNWPVIGPLWKPLAVTQQHQCVTTCLLPDAALAPGAEGGPDCHRSTHYKWVPQQNKLGAPRGLP